MIEVDLSKAKRKLNSATADKTLFALSEQILADSNYYIPKDEGRLEQSSIIATRSSNHAQIIWDTPYARRLYWNPQFNFSTDVNPNARGLWYKHAETQNFSNWLRIITKGF